tara:strand:- start:5138 stop:5428 length:291 start_codon:yes stop_codon:yes gene_type:complete
MNKFIKAPLSKVEKEKKAEDFLSFSKEKKEEDITINKKERVLKKEDTKAFLIRLPLSMMQDLTEISAITGISRNASCIELLRMPVREKLKELKEYK